MTTLNKQNTMSVKFKFTKKRNPSKPDEEAKWYAIPGTVNRLTTKSVCKIVTRGSSTYPTEAENTFNLVCDGIPHELQQGNSVQLGSLGWMRLSFGSKGVSEISEFDAATMIKNVKVIFTPSKELMAAIKQGLEFENAGVVEAGFTFPTTKSYLEYKQTGKLPVPGGSSTGGGGGNEELPLG